MTSGIDARVNRRHPLPHTVFVLAALLAIGCGEGPMVTPDLGGPACEPNGNFCLAGQTCVRSDGFCRGPGLCTERPETCITGGPEVIGCDGATYANECEAHRAGTSVDSVVND